MWLKASLQSLYFQEMNWRREDISQAFHTTCMWLSEHKIYQQWLKQKHGLLWIKGKPGAGKSTLMKHALEVAEQESEGSSIIASFFFHGRGGSIQKTSFGLFRSLLHQILQQVPSLLSRFTALYHKNCETSGEFGSNWNWRETELQGLLKKYLADVAQHQTIRIFVDALDECGEEAASKLVQYFQLLTSNAIFQEHELSVCFSCRHYPLIALENGQVIGVEDHNNNDIEEYVSQIIADRILNTDAVAVRSAKAIENEIIQRAAGVFQWVVIVLSRALTLHKRGKPPESILQSIRTTPTELSQLYETLLKGIDDEDKARAIQLMRWISLSFRPLSIVELRYAMAIRADSSYASIDECRRSQDFPKSNEEMEKQVIHLSSGLAEVRHHGGTHMVQFIHQTVGDFLLDSGLQILEGISADRALGSGHFWLSRSCVRYLAMKELENLLIGSGEQIYRQFPFLQYSTLFWIRHVKEVERHRLPQHDVVTFSQNANMLQTWIILCKCVVVYWRNGDEVGRLVYDWPSWPDWQTTLLHVAAAYGITSVLRIILSQTDADADCKDNHNRTPLHLAAAFGKCEVMEALLDRWDVDIDAVTSGGQTPLAIARQRKQNDAMNLLIARGAGFERRRVVPNNR